MTFIVKGGGGSGHMVGGSIYKNSLFSYKNHVSKSKWNDIVNPMWRKKRGL